MIWRELGRLGNLDRLQNEMDRMLRDFSTVIPRRVAAREEFPAINVWEHDDTVFAEAELPGLTTEDVNISVVGNELKLDGKRNEADVEGGSYHRRERGWGAFSRTLKLPYDVETGKVEAALRDGVLLITLPKAQAAKPRKIEVTTA